MPRLPLDPLPKKFAEKIESKFSVAAREAGSAADCVTDRTGAPGATQPRGILARGLTPRSGERIPNWWLRLRAIRTRLYRFLTRRSVLTAMITGSNGKTTTTNLLARILQEAGHVVGKANTDGIYIDGQQVWQGDSSGFKGAGWVMTDPRVTAAALETARGGLLTRGLYLRHVDAAALTNIGLEHLGDSGIHSQEQMAAHKKRVTDAARKAVVLNADDPHCRRIAADYPLKKTILYSCEAGNDFVRDHCARGGRALCVDGSGETEILVFREGHRSREILPLAAMPSARDGSLRFNVSNGLAAAGLALGMGLSLDEIARGLSLFQLDVRDNPGRFTFLDGYPADVLINYGSNPIGLRAIVPAIRALPVSGRRFCLVTAPDNRAEDHFALIAGELAGLFDRYLVYLVDRYVRVKEPGWAVDEIARELTGAGVSPERVSSHPSLDDAVHTAFAECVPGDLIVILGETMDHSIRSLENAARPPQHDLRGVT